MLKPNSPRDKLRKAGIRHYDELIHYQPKEWLLEGIPLSSSISIALTDRILTTSFYAFFGFLFGAKIIKEEIRRRFAVKRKARNSSNSSNSSNFPLTEP